MEEDEFVAWVGTLVAPELFYVESLLDQAEEQLEKTLMEESKMQEAVELLSNIKAKVYKKPDL